MDALLLHFETNSDRLIFLFRLYFVFKIFIFFFFYVYNVY